MKCSCNHLQQCQGQRRSGNDLRLRMKSLQTNGLISYLFETWLGSGTFFLGGNCFTRLVGPCSSGNSNTSGATLRYPNTKENTPSKCFRGREDEAIFVGVLVERLLSDSGWATREAKFDLERDQALWTSVNADFMDAWKVFVTQSKQPRKSRSSLELFDHFRGACKYFETLSSA